MHHLTFIENFCRYVYMLKYVYPFIKNVFKYVFFVIIIFLKYVNIIKLFFSLTLILSLMLFDTCPTNGTIQGYSVQNFTLMLQYQVSLGKLPKTS